MVLPISAALMGLGALAGQAGPGADHPLCVDLIAEKIVPVGRVCVEERHDTLYVAYLTDPDWALTETHVAAAGSRQEFPLAGGRQPILGQFGFTGTHPPGTREVVYPIILGSLPSEVGTSVFLAVHATVVRGNEERGAWARGTAFAPEGSPAAFFVYQRRAAPSTGRELRGATR